MARSSAREPLGDYAAKRDLERTPEPSGNVVSAAPSRHDGRRRFVIQHHRARRHHFDLRLEVDGVLVSWAVPKGPSMDPAVRSLAVKVEDHPLDYGWFEGTIPEGYGKGDVIVWDDGWWEPDPHDERGLDPAAAIESGELKARLGGRKLSGRFVLVSTGEEGSDQWLLLRKRDDEAVPGWKVEEPPRSVLTQRSNQEVADHAPPEWAPADDDELAALDAMGDGGPWRVGGHEVALTNLDKVLAPGREGAPPVTKREVVRHYAEIAPWIAPYLSLRPVNVHRLPDGVGSNGFWQKAVPQHAPEWIRRWPDPSAREGRTRHYLLLDGVASLVWAANSAAIEIHPWTGTAANPHQPTYALIDVDPGPSTSWDDTLLLTRLFGAAMAHLGLVSRPKVTGQRGVQVWVPVRRGATFDQTSRFVEVVSRTVGGRVPHLVSWRWHKDERSGLARLDYTQNALHKTLVAPFSLRPAPGLPVSVPIEWEELDDPGLRPDRWTLRDLRARLAERGDPFRELFGVEQDLPEL